MTLQENERKKLERNILLLFLKEGLGWGRFFVPVMALFYVASQVSLQEFSIIFAVFSLSILLLEVPSGIIADKFGKKNTILLSNALYVVELFLLAFGYGFWILLLAKIVSGIGVSLQSGAKQSLFYDSLKKLGREAEHKRLSGLLITTSQVTMAVVFITGAYFFSIHPKLPAFLSIPFLTVNFLLALLLYEPYKSVATKGSIHLMQSLRLAFSRGDIRYLMIFSFPIAAACGMLFNYSSIYYEKIYIPIALIGVLGFIQTMVSALSSYKAHVLDEVLGREVMFFLIQKTLLIAMLLMAFLMPYLGVLPYLLVPVAFGLHRVLTNHYINEHAPTSHRATILSINSMITQLAIFLLYPIIGYFLGNNFSQGLFIFFGVIAVCILLSFPFRKDRYFQQHP